MQSPTEDSQISLDAAKGPPTEGLISGGRSLHAPDEAGSVDAKPIAGYAYVDGALIASHVINFDANFNIRPELLETFHVTPEQNTQIHEVVMEAWKAVEKLEKSSLRVTENADGSQFISISKNQEATRVVDQLRLQLTEIADPMLATVLTSDALFGACSYDRTLTVIEEGNVRALEINCAGKISSEPLPNGDQVTEIGLLRSRYGHLLDLDATLNILK